MGKDFDDRVLAQQIERAAAAENECHVLREALARLITAVNETDLSGSSPSSAAIHQEVERARSDLKEMVQATTRCPRCGSTRILARDSRVPSLCRCGTCYYDFERMQIG